MLWDSDKLARIRPIPRRGYARRPLPEEGALPLAIVFVGEEPQNPEQPKNLFQPVTCPLSNRFSYAKIRCITDEEILLA